MNLLKRIKILLNILRKTISNNIYNKQLNKIK